MAGRETLMSYIAEELGMVEEPGVEKRKDWMYLARIPQGYTLFDLAKRALAVVRNIVEEHVIRHEKNNYAWTRYILMADVDDPKLTVQTTTVLLMPMFPTKAQFMRWVEEYPKPFDRKGDPDTTDSEEEEVEEVEIIDESSDEEPTISIAAEAVMPSAAPQNEEPGIDVDESSEGSEEMEASDEMLENDDAMLFLVPVDIALLSNDETLLRSLEDQTTLEGLQSVLREKVWTADYPGHWFFYLTQDGRMVQNPLLQDLCEDVMTDDSDKDKSMTARVQSYKSQAMRLHPTVVDSVKLHEITLARINREAVSIGPYLAPTRLNAALNKEEQFVSELKGVLNKYQPFMEPNMLASERPDVHSRNNIDNMINMYLGSKGFSTGVYWVTAEGRMFLENGSSAFYLDVPGSTENILRQLTIDVEMLPVDETLYEHLSARIVNALVRNRTDTRSPDGAAEVFSRLDASMNYGFSDMYDNLTDAIAVTREWIERARRSFFDMDDSDPETSEDIFFQRVNDFGNDYQRSSAFVTALLQNVPLALPPLANADAYEEDKAKVNINELIEQACADPTISKDAVRAYRAVFKGYAQLYICDLSYLVFVATFFYKTRDPATGEIVLNAPTSYEGITEFIKQSVRRLSVTASNVPLVTPSAIRYRRNPKNHASSEMSGAPVASVNASAMLVDAGFESLESYPIEIFRPEVHTEHYIHKGKRIAGTRITYPGDQIYEKIYLVFLDVGGLVPSVYAVYDEERPGWAIPSWDISGFMSTRKEDNLFDNVMLYYKRDISNGIPPVDSVTCFVVNNRRTVIFLMVLANRADSDRNRARLPDGREYRRFKARRFAAGTFVPVSKLHDSYDKDQATTFELPLQYFPFEMLADRATENLHPEADEDEQFFYSYLIPILELDHE